MRAGWLGIVSCALLGASLATACGDAFTEAGGPGSDGGHDDATGDVNDEADAGLLEASGIDVAMHDDARADAHDGGPGDTSMPDSMPDTMPDTSMPDTSMPDTSMPDTSMPDSSPPDASPPDSGPVGDACTLVIANESNGVFVSPSGSASGCGSRANPCNSIQTGINVARMSSKANVYVDNGTYVESISLVSNMTILGGWVDVGGNWTRLCGATNAANVILKAPPNANTTILANNATGAVIDTLTVKSKDASSVGAGESIYGIFASGSTNLTLTNVNVSVVAGGLGTNGSAGGAGANGTGTCAASDGSQGAGGSGGSPGTSSFSSAGFTTTVGGVGGQGGTGHAGTAGTSFGCVTVGACTDDGTGQCISTPGYDPATQFMSCGTNGSSGCGGGGSFGGSGGSGGGSSVGIYSWGATVQLSGGAVAAGNGGNGGAGAGGGSGGQGSAGVAGMSGPNGATGCVQRFNPLHCARSGTASGSAGGAGGTGGTGGVGGAGGGGAGGFSYSYYVGGGGSVTPSGTMLSFGSAGVGGSGGNTGTSGGAGAHN